MNINLNKQLPTVSVIMPAFNAESTIAESIKSVLNQTYTDWELIIINDNSTDNTYSVVEQYSQNDTRIITRSINENRGVSFVRNLAISLSSAKFIAFLDSDDLWHPLKLEIQLGFHERNPSCKISHTDYVNFNQNGIIKTPYKFIFKKFIKKDGDLLRQMLYFNSVGILTIILERKIFLEVNGFDCNRWGMEDHDLWLRISCEGHKFSFINKVLSYYMVNNDGMTSSIGRYKRTYKKFIDKHELLMIKYHKMSLAKAYFHRYFGLYYLNAGEFRLGVLYLRKSILSSLNPYLQIITLPYLLISFLKSSLKS